MEYAKFLQMKQCNVQDIDQSQLVDIRSVEIDSQESHLTRLVSYAEQTKNPYCFLCEGAVVKMSFADDEQSFEEALVKHFSKYK